MIKSWGSTKNVTALSSGEADYYAITKGASQGMGVRSMLKDFKVNGVSDHAIEIKEDSTAAKEIASRRGLGKLKHVDIKELWIQEKVASGDLKITKVLGTVNLADALTTYCDQHVVNYHLEHTDQQVKGDRHELMPQVCR